MPRTSVTATSYGANRSKQQAMSRASARSKVIARSRGAISRYSGRGELKTVDVSNNLVTLNATNTSVTLINGLAGGTNFYNRIGNKVTPVSIDADIVMINNSTTATSYQLMRAAIIWDKQPTGAVPAYTDIFRNVTADGTATTGAFTEGFTGRNMVTTDRFKTIAHFDAVLMPGNAASGSPWVRRFKVFKSLQGYQQQFKADTAAISSISTGACYMVLWAATDNTDTCGVRFDARYRYYDL